MKRILILALAIILISVTPALAHQPVILLDTDTSAAQGPLLVDGTISFAIRASFTKAGQKKGFRAALKAGDELAIQYLIVDQKPENVLKTSLLPSLVVTSPTGKKITVKLNERTKFFEPLGKTNYLYLARFNAPAEAGIYSFLITPRSKVAITVVVGERDTPGAVSRGELPTPTPTPTPTPSQSATPTPVGFTMQQVAANNTAASCWTVIDGFVYNLTAWINSHPGGAARIISLCGIDGTTAFKAQHANQTNPTQRLSGFLLGPLRS